MSLNTLSVCLTVPCNILPCHKTNSKVTLLFSCAYWLAMIQMDLTQAVKGLHFHAIFLSILILRFMLHRSVNQRLNMHYCWLPHITSSTSSSGV